MTVPLITEPDARSAGRSPHRLDRIPGWAWCLLAVVAAWAVCGIRLLVEPRYFFWDDSQLGAFGQWYGLGTKILQGDFALLSPGAWQGGNYLAEGQWGLWNPVTWLIALGSHAIGNATIYTTLVKVAFLGTFVVGAYLVARVYGARPWWAAVAGFTAGFGGQTIYLDAPSWVTGLQNVALFALCWWALKRHVDHGRSPLPLFVFGYLLVTFGYVFGVIELVVLFAVVLVEHLVRRRRDGLWRILVPGIVLALLTIFVFLPGVLTSPVTTRAGLDVANDQFLNMDLGDLATSTVSTAVSSVRGYWGDLAPVPLQYVTWLLPLLVVLQLRLRDWVRGLLVPYVVLGLTIALVIGPSVVGPLRYPARMMPYAVLAIAVLFAVLCTRGWPTIPRPSRVLLAVVLTAVSGWLSWAAQPVSLAWVVIAVVVQVCLIVAATRPGLPERFGSAAVAATLLLASVMVLVPQIVHYRTSPLGNFNVPSSVSAMAQVGDDKADGIMTVGDVYSLQRDPRSYRESLLANLWYLTGRDVASVYTVLPFSAFAQRLCIDLRGATCPGALETLFDGEDQPLVDDLALNTVVVIKGDGLADRPTPPAGWTVQEQDFTWLLRRTEPVPPAGGVARTDDGVTVTTLAQDATSVSFRIDAVDAPGDVVLSRLAWPGYASTGAELVAPDQGFLLTVGVTPEEVGDIVTVRFSPPGWTLEVACAVLAGLLGAAWTIWHLLDRRGSRRTPRITSA